MSDLDWNAFFNALLVFVLGVLGYFGVKGGYKQEDGRGPGVTHIPTPPLAGASVTTTTFTDDADIMALKQLTGEITGNAYATTEQSEATKALAIVVKDVGDKTVDALGDLTDQVRELRQEIARGRG